MIRETVGRAASGAQLIAAILVALGALRFAVSAVLYAVESRAPELPQMSASTGAPSATAAPTSSGGGGAPAPTASVPAGQSVRPTLSISAGPGRSDVYVNGVKRGKTPFLGEVSCKTGAPVRIEIVPARGAPLSFVRKCAPGTIRVGG